MTGLATWHLVAMSSMIDCNMTAILNPNLVNDSIKKHRTNDSLFAARKHATV